MLFTCSALHSFLHPLSLFPWSRSQHSGEACSLTALVDPPRWSPYHPTQAPQQAAAGGYPTPAGPAPQAPAPQRDAPGYAPGTTPEGHPLIGYPPLPPVAELRAQIGEVRCLRGSIQTILPLTLPAPPPHALCVRTCFDPVPAAAAAGRTASAHAAPRRPLMCVSRAHVQVQRQVDHLAQENARLQQQMGLPVTALQMAQPSPQEPPTAQQQPPPAQEPPAQQ